MPEQTRIKLDVNNMMEAVLGNQRGISPAAVDALRDAARNAQQQVQAKRGQGMRGWMDLPYNQDAALAEVEALAGHIRANFDTFVVLGIGGSALGPIAVQQALNHLRWNDLPAEMRNGPRLYVEDNIDPERMQSLLDVIDLKKTCFNVITKSGNTAETMSQYLIISEKLKEIAPDSWQQHIVATTSAVSGKLLAIADKEGLRKLVIPEGVGGRFSELCPVGLLAAAVCGIDIRAMLEGAKVIDKACQTDDVWQNAALLEATLQYICMQQMGINIQVMMPYADSLRSMADWFCQLWAESLGKNVTTKGEPVNVGQTPVKALGVTDQHSQLQLYTEGPYDKVVTFIKVERFPHQVNIPHGYPEIPDIAFLGGRSHNELIEAERKGTEYALCRAGRLNQTIVLPQVNAHTIGQLLYFFEMVTAYTGELLDIDAFNQPGVEESKIAAYAELGNDLEEKYIQKRAEMASRPKPDPKYIL